MLWSRYVICGYYETLQSELFAMFVVCRRTIYISWLNIANLCKCQKNVPTAIHTISSLLSILYIYYIYTAVLTLSILLSIFLSILHEISVNIISPIFTNCNIQILWMQYGYSVYAVQIQYRCTLVSSSDALAYYA